MSYISGKPEPNQVTLRPGVYQSKPTKGGLNLNKWLMRALKKVGFANTADPNCCVYYPVFPTLDVALINDPQEAEMVNVPPFAFFKCTDGESVFIYMRDVAAPGYILITNN